MTGRTWLAIGILLWTALSWGGRIRLLTGPEQNLTNWIRIGGSILMGVAAAVVLMWVAGGQVERWVLTAFAVWSTVTWVRSLASVWTGDQPAGFVVVHTVLAVAYLAFAFLAARTAWSPRGG